MLCQAPRAVPCIPRAQAVEGEAESETPGGPHFCIFFKMMVIAYLFFLETFSFCQSGLFLGHPVFCDP